jgi:hypothetical protein
MRGGANSAPSENEAETWKTFLLKLLCNSPQAPSGNGQQRQQAAQRAEASFEANLSKLKM